MAGGDEYRVKAADMHARARLATALEHRLNLEDLALAYLRLADQADRNSTTDLVYETRPAPAEQPNVQQQQQPQPDNKLEE